MLPCQKTTWFYSMFFWSLNAKGDEMRAPSNINVVERVKWGQAPVYYYTHAYQNNYAWSFFTAL